jgi:heptosyltransferase-2
LSGVRQIFHYRKDSIARRLFVRFRIPSPVLQKHTLDRYLSVLDKLNVPIVHKFPQIDDWKFNLSENKFYLPARPIIGVNPGSIWNTKRWLPERYAKLITNLAYKYKTRIVIVGGKNELELNKKIQSLAGTDNCINLTGTTDIVELMAIIKKMDIFITNDSGPMHIAIVMNIPTIAIFGPTTKELGFFPYGNFYKLIEAPLKCRPCALHGARECPRKHFLCMRLITIDMVFNAAVEMLSIKAGEQAHFQTV